MYLIDSLTKLSTWINEQKYEQLDGHPETIHIGVFAGSDNLIHTALMAFRALLEKMSDIEFVKPVLVIPLGEESEVDPRNWTDLESALQQLSTEAPSLGLLHRNDDKKFEIVEEFKKPIELPDWINVPGVVLHGYYRSFRNADAILHGWSFERCLYIEGYPG